MFSNWMTELEKANQNKLNNNGFTMKRRPPVDIYETEGEIVLLAEMPGINKNELKVQIKDGLLNISGVRRSSHNNTDYILRETSDIQYERIFEVGNDLDPEKVSANYNGGILKVSIGKKESTKPKQISIK